jgi:hypothetical protein
MEGASGCLGFLTGTAGLPAIKVTAVLMYEPEVFGPEADGSSQVSDMLWVDREYIYIYSAARSRSFRFERSGSLVAWRYDLPETLPVSPEVLPVQVRGGRGSLYARPAYDSGYPLTQIGILAKAPEALTPLQYRWWDWGNEDHIQCLKMPVWASSGYGEISKVRGNPRYGPLCVIPFHSVEDGAAYFMGNLGGKRVVYRAQVADPAEKGN